jgi:hypothetical protein
MTIWEPRCTQKPDFDWELLAPPLKVRRRSLLDLLINFAAFNCFFPFAEYAIFVLACLIVAGLMAWVCL